MITITAVLSDVLADGEAFANTATITTTTADGNAGNNDSAAWVTVYAPGELNRIYLPVVIRNW